ncbi:MAG: S41 family peptidase [Desulfobacterales bacterium]|nr:S41 family peptidase [Desulfobacterales bacterium]
MTLLLRRYRGIVGVILCLSVFLWLGPGVTHEHPFAGTDNTYEELRMFSDVLDIIEKNYVDHVDSKKLVHGAIQGMLKSLDPHSSFLSPEVFKELQIDTRGEFSGIGIVITMQNDMVTVISPIEGSPAHKAGIKPGDQIVKVDGEETKDLKLWEAVKKMRGKKGTKVLITVRRKGLAELKDFPIIRDVIPLESVRSFVLKPGYGYLRITNFRDRTLTDTKKALKKLDSSETPLKGLILDLRDNPGGLLDQAIKVADIFLDKGSIVSIKGRSSAHCKTFSAHRDETKHHYPIVLLINEGSASASEIVAGALQDHGRALVMGVTSFGKGSVQAVEPLRDGSGLKLTIARYYTPKGHTIQAKGIIPDVVVQERLVSETETRPERHVKEKDLKNHISAKPKEKTSKDLREEINKIRGVKVPGRELSEVAKVLLTNDNQVRRALETLMGWQIFSKMAR